MRRHQRIPPIPNRDDRSSTDQRTTAVRHPPTRHQLRTRSSGRHRRPTNPHLANRRTLIEAPLKPPNFHEGLSVVGAVAVTTPMPVVPTYLLRPRRQQPPWPLHIDRPVPDIDVLVDSLDGVPCASHRCIPSPPRSPRGPNRRPRCSNHREVETSTVPITQHTATCSRDAGGREQTF